METGHYGMRAAIGFTPGWTARLHRSSVMARSNTRLQNEFPYGLNARSNNRDWFDLPMPECWKIYSDKVNEAMHRYQFRTHAFVLMSNHYHWLVSTPESNLSSGMQYFSTESSRSIARGTGRINRIYGARYHSTLIGTPAYYANTLRYFYQNPVRAGICSRVEDYSWSTLARPHDIVLSPCEGFEEFVPNSPEEFLMWVNELPPTEFNQALKKATRKRVFKFPRKNSALGRFTGFEYLRCTGSQKVDDRLLDL